MFMIAAVFQGVPVLTGRSERRESPASLDVFYRDQREIREFQVHRDQQDQR